MNFLEALLVGLNEARRHLGQTVLSLLGLILGTGSIVTVLALFGGQTKQTTDFIIEQGGFGAIIVYDREESLQPTPMELASRRLTYRDAAYLKDHATMLKGVAPGYFGRHDYRVGNVDFEGDVIGTTPDYAMINAIFPMAGRYISDLDVRRQARVMVLGWAYADSLFKGRPDRAVGRIVNLGGKNYTVVGVMEREEFYWAPWSGNALAYRNRRAYIPITTAFSQYTGENDRLDFLTLKAITPTGGRAAEAQVRQMMLLMHGVEDFDIRPLGQRDADDAQFFMMFNIIFLIVGVVSLFAGGVVIANILLASVAERVREFGTRMALGASGVQVFTQVIAQVFVIAVFGGLLGLGLGTALTGAVAHFMSQPAAVTGPMAAVALGTSLGVGAVAGFYPAWRAARLSPVEALRYG
jgi:ABC-type antimicrobial peptide transport system permease subunit